jgi:threonine aldolase
VFGGGWRQAGYLAAAGIYALENNIERLAIDHKHTKDAGRCFEAKRLTGNILPVETNILIFEVKGRYTPESFTARLREENIKVIAISKTQVRMVLHLDITEEMVLQTIKLVEQL